MSRYGARALIVKRLLPGQVVSRAETGLMKPCRLANLLPLRRKTGLVQPCSMQNPTEWKMGRETGLIQPCGPTPNAHGHHQRFHQQRQARDQCRKHTSEVCCAPTLLQSESKHEVSWTNTYSQNGYGLKMM